MGRHAAPEDEKEFTDDLILPPDTPPWLRALCYIVVYSLAALGFWCIYLEIFVR